MNSIVGFFVGIFQATLSFLGLSHQQTPLVDLTEQTRAEVKQDVMSPQDVVSQYGTLPNGLPDSAQTNTHITQAQLKAGYYYSQEKKTGTPDNWQSDSGAGQTIWYNPSGN